MAYEVEKFGNKIWCNSQGQRHRTDGPAVIWPDGAQGWFINDQLHHINGPAVIYADGTQHWFINGRNITREVEAWMIFQDVMWPWDTPTQTLFVLTFGI